jgi:hypothetical protein
MSKCYSWQLSGARRVQCPDATPHSTLVQVLHLHASANRDHDRLHGSVATHQADHAMISNDLLYRIHAPRSSVRPTDGSCRLMSRARRHPGQGEIRKMHIRTCHDRQDSHKGQAHNQEGEQVAPPYEFSSNTSTPSGLYSTAVLNITTVNPLRQRTIDRQRRMSQNETSLIPCHSIDVFHDLFPLTATLASAGGSNRRWRIRAASVARRVSGILLCAGPGPAEGANMASLQSVRVRGVTVKVMQNWKWPGCRMEPRRPQKPVLEKRGLKEFNG